MAEAEEMRQLASQPARLASSGPCVNVLRQPPGILQGGWHWQVLPPGSRCGPRSRCGAVGFPVATGQWQAIYNSLPSAAMQLHPVAVLEGHNTSANHPPHRNRSSTKLAAFSCASCCST